VARLEGETVIAEKKTRRRKSGCRRLLNLGLILGIALVLFALGASLFAWKALNAPYKGFEGDATIVEIRRGWNTDRILRTLREEGVLRDEYAPLVYVKLFHSGEFLKAGHYRFEGESRPIDVLEKLIAGDTILHSITLREGLDRFQVGQIMSAEGFGTIEQWNELTSDPELILDLSPEADSLEGYLFPDTYLISPGAAPRTIVRMMVDNFRRNISDELAYIDTDLSVHETIIVASIVETEARIPEERPLIAGVYLNRIRKGMLLGADPTVIYALKLRDEWDGNITRENLQVDSPYNTYRYRGIPPGPIANPGLASIQAAARPTPTEYLYFVSRNDGSHVFARTLAEHNRNVHQWQRLYWRQKRAEEAARQQQEEAQSEAPGPEPQ
jgi:UPF0755 protein